MNGKGTNLVFALNEGQEIPETSGKIVKAYIIAQMGDALNKYAHIPTKAEIRGNTAVVSLNSQIDKETIDLSKYTFHLGIGETPEDLKTAEEITPEKLNAYNLTTFKF